MCVSECVSEWGGRIYQGISGDPRLIQACICAALAIGDKRTNKGPA